MPTRLVTSLRPATGLLLLALAALGCSTPPEDDDPAATEELPSTTTSAPLATTTAPPTTTTPTTTTTAPPTTTTTTTTTEIKGEDVLETVVTETLPDVVRQRLFPWDEGFLHMGFERIEERNEEPCDPARLVARLSTDGLEWTEFLDLEIPSVHAAPSGEWEQHYPGYRCYRGYSFPLRISSDGKRLAIASQWPLGLETWARTTATSAAGFDAVRQIQPTIYLSVTEDLITWDTIEIPIDRPEDLHDSLQTEPFIAGLSLHDDGWVMELNTFTYMNVFSRMPEDIRRSATEARPVRFGPLYDERDGGGMMVEWWTDEALRDGPHSRFVSWDELGTTSELFTKYGYTQDAYPHRDLFSGSMIVASWGEEPRYFDLPDIPICCDVVATDAGYLALSSNSIGGYHPAWFGSGTLLFSPDGREWEQLDDLAGREIWVHSIHGVNGGVMAFGSPSPESAAFYEDEWDNHFWLGSPDGSNWRRLDMPAFTSLMDWLMAHDRAPTGWPGVAIQSNIVLRIEYDNSVQTYGSSEMFTGAIRRYVVPE